MREGPRIGMSSASGRKFQGEFCISHFTAAAAQAPHLGGRSDTWPSGSRTKTAVHGVEGCTNILEKMDMT